MVGKMTPKRITVHCSATPNGKPVSIDAIRKFHTDPPPDGRGWKDIGYHFLIGIDGQVHAGRPTSEQGAGVEGANENNLHVCMVGTDKFTIDQWNALREQLDASVREFGIERQNVFGHNCFASAWAQGKSCPGFPANLLMHWYLTGLNRSILEYVF
jgi:N-acetylmuramoyl-L-alanine amidase